MPCFLYQAMTIDFVCDWQMKSVSNMSWFQKKILSQLNKWQTSAKVHSFFVDAFFWYVQVSKTEDVDPNVNVNYKFSKILAAFKAVLSTSEKLAGSYFDKI